MFNGDNLVANALFNYASSIRPYYGIIPQLLSLKECIELAKLVVSTSINRLDYFFDIRKRDKVPQTVGGQPKLAIIDKEKFEWID